MLSLLFALGSAFANSLNVVTQHVASTAAPSRDKGWRLALYLIRSPLWLAGVGAMVAGFVLQALALYNGRISVVQSILISELVFTLVLAKLWLRRDVLAAAWASAFVTSAGLAVFLVMSEPEGGHADATRNAWLPALLSCGLLAALLAFLARKGSPLKRAALYATASGIVWAAFATFLKSATDVLGADGIPAMLKQGGIYGVIVGGIVGTILTQAALHYGPLSVSQPLMVIVNPVFSIILGIWLYGEHFKGGSWRILVAVLGFAAMIAGVVFLARTAPSLASEPQTAGVDKAD